MKRLILCLLLLAPMSQLFANNADSAAYQLQRQRINNMLEQRRQRFSQYTKSLDEHTGIFGWQTKKDIKRSGEILMDIVKTDNDIFKELKVLFDYRNFEQTQVIQRSHESENLLPGYMATINKLRAQNDILIKQHNDQESALKGRQTNLYIVIVLLVFMCIFLYTKRSKPKRR